MPARAAFRTWGRWVARRRLARGLAGVSVHGLDAVRSLLAQGPVILAANHVCFYDSLLVVDLSHQLDARSHVLVDASRLDDHLFFVPFGAIGVDRRAPRRGLKAAADALRGPSDALWIFPQGRYRPPHLRPLQLERGVEVVARSSGAPVVPVALQYSWVQEDRPTAFVRFGPPTAGRVDELEEALVALLDTIDAEVVERSSVPAAPTAGSRVLSWLVRFLGVGRA